MLLDIPGNSWWISLVDTVHRSALLYQWLFISAPCAPQRRWLWKLSSHCSGKLFYSKNILRRKSFYLCLLYCWIYQTFNSKIIYFQLFIFHLFMIDHLTISNLFYQILRVVLDSLFKSGWRCPLFKVQYNVK